MHKKEEGGGEKMEAKANNVLLISEQRLRDKKHVCARSVHSAKIGIV